MSLPIFFGLTSKNNNKYLRYISENTQVHGFLQFSGDELVTPFSKFHVEVAKNGKEDSFVHIRCAYNNKYLARWSKNHGWITARTDEPNEDQSSWSCTLFEPVAVDNNPNVIRLRHVQLGHYVSLGTGPEPFTSCLFAGSTNDNHDNFDVFIVTNLETLFVLPKYIAIMGDNGAYLSAQLTDKQPYLQFISYDNKDATVWYETFINKDGSVRVKSYHFAKFWRRNSNNWILADSDDTTTTDPNTVFSSIEVKKNVAAVRILGSNKYCKRYTGSVTGGLKAITETITQYAMLYLEETVSSRFIYDVEYHLTDARIYDKSQVILSSLSAQNNTDNPLEVSFKISYSYSMTTIWNSTISRKIFNKVNLEAKICTIENKNIDITGDFSGEYIWGEPVTKKTQIDNNYTATVPAKTRVIVDVIATKAWVDIPFKYSQKDALFEGKEIISNIDDGLFTGSNLFDFKYDVKHEPIVK